MEYEVRYYFNSQEKDKLLNLLNNQKELIFDDRYYEKTILYDHPNSEYSFYSKKIDGRFRVRLSKSTKKSKSKLSFKRRLSDTISSDINKEIEKEVNFDFNDYDNMIYIINEVLHMKLTESYERYRNVFENDYIEIVIDEYPFGIALEIEAKDSCPHPSLEINNWVKKLGLNDKEKYRLSWDDKYYELCKKQNIKIYNEVSFDKEMSEVL